MSTHSLIFILAGTPIAFGRQRRPVASSCILIRPCNTMHSLIGVALLSSIASGFSCGNAHVPSLATSSSPAFSRNLLQSKSSSSYCRDSLMIRGGGDSVAISRSSSARAITTISGGGSDVKGTDLNLTTGKILSSMWGSIGVVYILVKAIKRVVPIALEPFLSRTVVPLTRFQLGAYIFTCLWFAYVEGYRGFQTKFSPLVVSRSFTLQPSSSPILHLLFAPFYSMGLFHATKKRMIISWSVSIGVAVIVAAVKRLPYPWRNIVDAGVVVGLTWGTISILGGYIISLITGIAPIDVDPSLPEKEA